MPIDNPTLCCLMGVCCGPAQRQAALTKTIDAWMDASKSLEQSELSAHIAQQLLGSFDLAPAGTLAPLLKAYEPFFEFKAEIRERGKP